MRPHETDAQDWYLYWDNTYMLHNTRGFCRVSRACEDSGDDFEIRTIPENNVYAVRAETLNPLWITSGAINFNDQGMYIGRCARREARRSSTSHHYQILFGGHGQVSGSQLFQLYQGEEYPNIRAALAKMALMPSTQRLCTVAISRDLILSRIVASGCQIYWRGIAAGTIQEKDTSYEFLPDITGSPVARRVQFKLQKEGLLC